jgi:hypothetical protein
MIEEQIDRKSASVLDSLRGRRSMTLQELGLLLPPDVMAWCKAEASERILEEWRTTSFTTQTLSTSTEVRRVVQGTIGSLLPFTVFKDDALEHVVREGFRFAGRYVFRPRQTLTAQVFRGSDSVTAELLDLRLSAATEYRYLPLLLLRLLAGEPGIAAERFRPLLADVDDATLRQHSPEEFARLMTPIALWFAEPGAPASAVPVEAILDFLEDKEKLVMRDYFKSIARIRSRAAMDFDEIASLVKDLEVSEHAVAAETTFPVRTHSVQLSQHPPVPDLTGTAGGETPGTPPPEGETTPQAAPAPLSVEPSLPTTPEERSVPLQPSFDSEREGLLSQAREAEFVSELLGEEQHADELKDSAPVDAPSSAEAEGVADETVLHSEESDVAEHPPDEQVPDVDREALPEEAEQPSGQLNEPIIPEYSEETAVATPQPAQEIPEESAADSSEPATSVGSDAPQPLPAAPPGPPPPLSFPPDLRSSLADSLFHGNVAYFDATVDQLNKLTTWREAAGYLTDLLEINRLNPYATDVMQFTDHIRRWFVREDEEQAG